MPLPGVTDQEPPLSIPCLPYMCLPASLALCLFLYLTLLSFRSTPVSHARAQWSHDNGWMLPAFLPAFHVQCCCLRTFHSFLRTSGMPSPGPSHPGPSLLARDTDMHLCTRMSVRPQGVSDTPHHLSRSSLLSVPSAKIGHVTGSREVRAGRLGEDRKRRGWSFAREVTRTRVTGMRTSMGPS